MSAEFRLSDEHREAIHGASGYFLEVSVEALVASEVEAVREVQFKRGFRAGEESAQAAAEAARAEAVEWKNVANVARVQQERADVDRRRAEAAERALVERIEAVAARIDRHTEVEQDDVQFRDANTGVWWDVTDVIRAALTRPDAEDAEGDGSK